MSGEFSLKERPRGFLSERRRIRKTRAHDDLSLSPEVRTLEAEGHIWNQGAIGQPELWAISMRQESHQAPLALCIKGVMLILCDILPERRQEPVFVGVPERRLCMECFCTACQFENLVHDWREPLGKLARTYSAVFALHQVPSAHTDALRMFVQVSNRKADSIAAPGTVRPPLAEVVTTLF